MHDDRPSTVTAPSPATLFVALDLSRSSWVVAVHAPHAAGKVSRHKLAPGAEGLLATQGIDDYQPLRPDRLERLGALVTGDGRPLPERLAAEVRRHLRRLELVLEMLAEVEAERDRKVADAAGKEALLPRLKGIGPEGAAGLCAELFYRPFANRRGVAAYAGLAPSPFASGDSRREQGIGKAGNARVRRMMVELAWLWVRLQPETAPGRWFAARVGSAKGRVRRIAVVALARKLLVTPWTMLR